MLRDLDVYGERGLDAVRDGAGVALLLGEHVVHAEDRLVVGHAHNEDAAGRVRERDEGLERLREGDFLALEVERAALGAGEEVGEIGHQGAFGTASSWIALSVRPRASFHSVRPFEERPRTTPAAVEGEEKA